VPGLQRSEGVAPLKEKNMDPLTRTTGYRTIMNANHPIVTELRRTGPRRWVVTTNICNGTADYGTATEFRTLKAAREAFKA